MAHEQLTHQDPVVFDSSRIDLSSPTVGSDIRETVLDGDVVLLKDVFDSELLLEFREQVFEWGQDSAAASINIDDSRDSFHRFHKYNIDANFPRLDHFYCLHGLLGQQESSDQKAQKGTEIFQKLKELYNVVCGTNYEMKWYEDGPSFHPQLVQYPRGGGFFGLHRHYVDLEEIDYEPMKLNMVLSASELGSDYEKGGLRAINGGDIFDLKRQHQIGDIAIFRYDLSHGVLPVDPEADLDWKSENGRWSIMLPFHP